MKLNYLDISTGHVTQEDAEKLNAFDPDDLPFRIMQDEYGWIIWIPSSDYFLDSVEKLEEKLGFSPAIGNVMRYAKRKGCNAVLFDRDADPCAVDELEYFQW